MDFIKKKNQISIRTNKFQESKQRRNLIEENSNQIDGGKKKKEISMEESSLFRSKTTLKKNQPMDFLQVSDIEG